MRRRPSAAAPTSPRSGSMPTCSPRPRTAPSFCTACLPLPATRSPPTSPTARALAVLAWAWYRDFLRLTLLDLAAPALALGYAIGRCGCQLSGDGDYGKAWDGPWAMSYPDGTVPTDRTVHPTPIYETLAMGLGAWILWQLRDRFRAGVLFAIYLVYAGAERFLVEFIRRNSDVALGLTSAQLESLAMMVAGVTWIWVVKRRHGVLSRVNASATPDPRPAG